MAFGRTSFPSHLPAPTGDAKADALLLADALSALAQRKLFDGVKAMTTDLDRLFLDLKKEFEEQVALCDRFRSLALAYRPIRNGAVSVVLTLKDFAEESHTVMMPCLKEALDDGNVNDVAEVMAELLGHYKEVHRRLSKLKDEHNGITAAARALSDQAAQKAQAHLHQQQIANQKSEVAVVTGAVAGCEVAIAGAAMVCTGAGPVGWLCLSVGAAVGVGAGGTLYHQEVAYQVNKTLVKSATTINQQMMKVTVQLEAQCTALEKIVTKLESCTSSTEKIQKLVDAWTEEGAQKTKMQEKRLNLWLDQQFPSAMVELSAYCAEYLGDEAKERERLIVAMNMSVEQPAMPVRVRPFSGQKAIRE